jgi:lipoprotein-releasing system ATP-binding protein
VADTLLSVSEIVKDYPAPGGPLRVLDGVSFDLAGGGTLVVTGPSGSGKSTLLNIIGLLDAPTSGEVLFRGEPVVSAERPGFDPARAAAFRNGEIGFVFQDHHLLPQCTALENVLIPALAAGRLFGRMAAEVEARGRELLESVGLAERRQHFPAELSGGERQRVALARALVNRPGLILADEPTGNLDAQAAREVAELLLRVRDRSGAALIVVTHNEEFAGMFGRRAALRGGKLVE